MSNRLPVLAEVANSHHDVAAASLRVAAEHARHAGDALIEAKALLPHGKWSGWIKAHFRGGMRTAQRYMKIAKNWETIAGKNVSVTHLSVMQVLSLLDGGGELERALKNQAELDALQSELDFLNKAVKSADEGGLRFILKRLDDINPRLIHLRDVAIGESARLRKELEAMKATA